MRRIEEQDGKGNVLRTTEYDIDAGMVTVIDSDGTAVSSIPPDELESLRAVDRETQQEARLRTNFQQLRQTPPAASLTNAQLRDEVDLLRAMLLDLTRVVRGIAAE